MKKLTLKKTTLSRLNSETISKVRGGYTGMVVTERCLPDTKVGNCPLTEQQECCVRYTDGCVELTSDCLPTEICK